MQFSLATVLLGLAAVASASIVDVEGIRNLPRDSIVVERAGANGNRPTPSGNCCIAKTSLKQDTCTAANGATGRCVPGGEACKSKQSLS